MDILPVKREQAPPPIGALEKYWVFTGLILTTVISSLLLAGDVGQWILSKNVYDFVVRNRASTQLIVQVCANALGFLHVTIICLLIKYAASLRLASVAVSLDTLQFWTDLLSRHLDWKIPVHFFIPVLAFIGLCIVPSALWAAAITPISVTAFRQQMILLPSYSDTALLNSNWSHRDGGPSFRNNKGFFTYNVGEEYLGSLLDSASSATTIDGSVRQHAKNDFSRFTYSNRSYGVGASVGLVDDDIILDPLVTQYTYLEAGYAPMVTCIYNTSSAYFINTTTEGVCNLEYAAYGYLPNSHSWEPEWSRYTGFSTDSIVAIGVASAWDVVGRMIGIAAGINYAKLNNTQCTIDFQPALFNVTVDLVHRNISVAPIETAVNVTDIEPSGMLSFLATWQLTLISTDQTSLYTSLVGNSFNASISNYIASAIGKANDPTSEGAAALGGLGNSVTAMIDDILICYASAQLMVANETQTGPASVGFQALRLGQRGYIIAITIFNSALVVIVLLEAFRTRGWRGLVDFDFMDPRTLIISSSRGGEGIAAAADDRGASYDTSVKRNKAVAHNIGRIRIKQEGLMLVPANSLSRLEVKHHSDASVAIGRPKEGIEVLALEERTEGANSNEGTELLTLDERRQESNLSEGRKEMHSDEEREEMVPDTERQRLSLNEETGGLMSNEATEGFTPPSCEATRSTTWNPI